MVCEVNKQSFIQTTLGTLNSKYSELFKLYKMDRSLKLSEKLFCLAINPKNGGIFLNASSTLAITLAGSVFLELMNKGVLTIENGMVHLQNPTVQNDEVDEFFLQRIRECGKTRKLRSWISRFNLRGRKIQKHFIRTLVRKNVLRTEERSILFIPYEKVFVMDHELIEAIRKEVEDIFLKETELTGDALILASMVEQTNLLSRIFPERTRRKEARHFLKSLPETPVTKAVHDAIQMMHAAVFAATT